MYTPIIRIINIIFSFVLAAFFYSKEDYVKMSIILISGLFFIYGYFKYGTVYIALLKLKKGNFKKAEDLISKTKHPEKLTNAQKSNYYFITGIIALEKMEIDKSHSDLTQAMEIGLRTENDTSIALLHLAKVEFLKKDYEKANEYIKKIRQLQLKPVIELETKRIEEEIKKVAQ